MSNSFDRSGEQEQSSVQKRKARKEEKKHKHAENPDGADQHTNRTEKRAQKKEARMKRPRRRVLPIWLRIIIVLLLCAGALITGLMIGYGVIGDGSPADALRKETWQHLIEIVTGSK